MESVLRKLRVDIDECKKGSVAEIFITRAEEQDTNLYLHIQVIGEAEAPKYLTIKQSEFDDYFEREDGLDKVYMEYRSQVSKDIILNSRLTHKETIIIALVTLFILLAMLCVAVWIGGTAGVVLTVLSLFTLVTFLVAMNSRSKRRIKLDSYEFTERRDARKQELVHMLTNLGYIKIKTGSTETV